MGEVTTVRERPIIFSGPMVKALLSGQKTMTRRVIKPQPTTWVCDVPGMDDIGGMDWKGKRYEADEADGIESACPKGKVGDRLWVKETWSPDHAAFYPNFPVVYKADGYPADWEIEKGRVHSGEAKEYFLFRWRSPLFMPRDRSRITLEITEVRVERLNDVSESDARSEGFATSRPTRLFRKTWDQLNGEKHPWSSNPWLWIISFRRLEPRQ